MKTTVNQRFAMMIKALGLSKNAFAKTLGVASTQVYNIINGRNAPSFDLLSRIALTYPTVNMHWLLTGKGAILSTKLENTEESVNILAKIKQIEDQMEKISAKIKNGDKFDEEKVLAVMKKAWTKLKA